MALRKFPTGIRKLDEILGGGIPEGHIVLVSGSAGTMKTSLAYSILYHNALRGVPGLYITVEQNPESIRSQVEGMGLASEEARSRIRVYDAAESRGEAGEAGIRDYRVWSTLFRGVIEFEMKNHQIQLVAIDSLNLFELMTEAKNPRLDLFDLFRKLRSKKLTTLAITEVPSDAAALSLHDEDYMADGVFHLKVVPVDDVRRQLRIAIPKMRGVKHTRDSHALEFADGRFQLRPATRKSRQPRT